MQIRILALGLAAFIMNLALPLSAADQSAVDNGIIFHLTFQEDGIARLAGGLGHPLTLEAGSMETGFEDSAYRFEPPYRNYLPASLATPSPSLHGFTAGDGVALVVKPDGWQRTPAIVANGPAGMLWRTDPTELTGIRHPHRNTKTLIGSVYLRAGVSGIRVRLTLRDEIDGTEWQTAIAEANAAALEKDAEANIVSPIATQHHDQELELSEEWQRVIVRITVDARRPVQRLSLQLTRLDGDGAVETSALQLEQGAQYPDQKTHAAPWIPGGEVRAGNSLSLPLSTVGLNADAGTMAAWYRLPEPEGGGTRQGYLVCAGGGWWQPIWELRDGLAYMGDPGAEKYSGGGRIPFRSTTHDGEWHHLAMTWQENECVVYLDGQEKGRNAYPKAEPSPTARLLIGATSLSGATSSAIVDEVVIWNRALSAEELAALASRSVSPKLAPELSLAAPPRTIFHRGEASATLPLRVLAGAEGGPRQVTVVSPELALNEEITLSESGIGELRLHPWKATAGRHTIGASSTDGRIDAILTIEVVASLPVTDFQTVGWGDWEASLDYPFTSAMAPLPAMSPILRNGRHASLRIDERATHPLDPIRYPANLEGARRQAVEAAPWPHIGMVLLNTEVGMGAFPTDEWFQEWMQAEIGLTEIPASVKLGPLRVADPETPPVLPLDDPALRFVRWMNGPGKGWPRFNHELAEVMRDAGMEESLFYTDQPHVVDDVRGHDMVEYWHYPHVPGGFVTDVNRVANVARLAGVKLMVTPGSIFWDPWDLKVDGKTVCMPPDMMRLYLWIAAANPVDHLGFWGFGNLKNNDFGAAGTIAALKETLPAIQPIGLLTGGLPTASARVAYLQTDGQSWIGPGDNQWGIWWFNRMATRSLAEAHLPFDWIGDEHVAAGWLSRYDVVFMPGGWTVPQDTFQALVDYARQGGKVVVDTRCRAEIPGAEVLDIGSQKGRSAGTDHVETLQNWARTMRDAYPVTTRVRGEDLAWIYEKIEGDARFIFVLNDSFEPGVLAEHGVSANLGTRTGAPHDKGLPQEVVLTLPRPAGALLYDARSGAELSLENDTVSLALPAGDAAVLALVPERIVSLNAEAPKLLLPGDEGLLSIRIEGATGTPIVHRDVLTVTGSYADGTPIDMPAMYRVNNGQLTIPLRLPLNAPAGPLRISLTEQLAGLQQSIVVTVTTPR